MRFLMFFGVLLASLRANSQKVVDVASSKGVAINTFYTVGGVPFVNTKFVNLVEGTPYFKDEWLTGLIVATNGQRFGGSLVKLNLVQNQLHFLNAEGEEMVATVVPKEIWLHDSLKNTRYHLVSSALVSPSPEKNDWYQVIEQGKADLLKASLKVLSESLQYGSSTHEQRIYTKDRYYLDVTGELKPVKSEKDIIGLLPDKKTELEAFLKTLDKKLSTEERLASLVRYYNSLEKKE